MFPLKSKLICLILLFNIDIINSTTYYVASNGNDQNSGTSTIQPWKTLAKVQSSTFLAKDIVSFRCGDTFTLSANWSSPRDNINFNSYGTGNRPIIDVNTYVIEIGFTNADHPKSYITFTNMKFTNSGHGTSKSSTFWMENPDHVTLESCNIDGGGGGIYAGGSAGAGGLTIRNSTLSNNATTHAIYINGVDNVLMEYDTLIGNCKSGIRIAFGNDNHGTDNLTVRYCVLKNNGAYAVIDDGAKNSNFYYNLFETNTSGGYACIYIYQGLSSMTGALPPHDNNYYNNTCIAQSRNDFMQIGDNDPNPYIDCTNMVFINNIFYHTGMSRGAYGISFFGSSLPQVPTTWIFNNNLYYGFGKSSWSLNGKISWATWHEIWGFDNNTLNNSNPLFKSSSDYSLQSTSPAINNGTNVGLIQDILGNAVPSNSPDIGAYQHRKTQ
jgi:Right handed beta helix region